MASAADISTETLPGVARDATRRDFLVVATTALGAVGAAVAMWPPIDQMNPDAATLAQGAPMDIDLSRVEPGQQIVVLWRSTPIFIMHRTEAALRELQNDTLASTLSDPDSSERQQPTYAANWHRSIKPEYAVLIGICTHLGCIPDFRPQPNARTDWPGGYFCPCHGSKYDLAGRVFRGVPAPYNLPVPPYRFPDDKTLRIGENPEGESFQMTEILQL
jgi:ubiquinol-cytochrome c reductase iron-sulfur subunit